MKHLDYPSPHFNDAKMARFLLLRAFIVALGGWEIIDLITVFDAILTARQSGQKLQCLYGNPIANNFFQN